VGKTRWVSRAAGSVAVDESTQRLSGFAAGPVLGIAAVTVGVLLAVASRYGYHRDELYFLAASRHLAWGYVDQPPIAVLVAWLDRSVLGDTLLGLRLLPALCVGGVVMLTAAMARELGGSRFAQAFAALCVATAGFLVLGHLEGPSIYDVLVWALVSWLVLRILRTSHEQLWLAVGLTIGVGLEAKQTILLLLAGLAIGLVWNRQTSVLSSRWFWVGVAVAVAGWAPNLLWEASHAWPTLAMDSNLRSEHSGVGYALKYPFITLLAMGALLVPVWTAGWWALWHRPSMRPYRAFAIAFVFGFLFLWIVIPDRFYYLFGIYPVLFASGAIVAERVATGASGFFRERARHRWLWRSRTWAIGIVLVNGITFLPLGLPVLPESVVASANLQKLNYNLGEEIGWPELTRQVATVWHSLPPSTRRDAVIVTDNYGEAGAIIRFGARYALPTAYSGHNSFWTWGPPKPSRGTTIAIGIDRRDLLPYFERVQLAARIHNHAHVNNDEAGNPIWICTRQRQPWPAIWPRFKHYG
jgi:Dolichyl-phosphate-mannose-protein mannosyltransferase